jgi:hypothetical protein
MSKINSTEREKKTMCKCAFIEIKRVVRYVIGSNSSEKLRTFKYQSFTFHVN